MDTVHLLYVRAHYFCLSVYTFARIYVIYYRSIASCTIYYLSSSIDLGFVWYFYILSLYSIFLCIYKRYTESLCCVFVNSCFYTKSIFVSVNTIRMGKVVWIKIFFSFETEKLITFSLFLLYKCNLRTLKKYIFDYIFVTC